MKLTRRELGLGLVALGGAAALGTGPSRAQPKSLEIIAAAGPGGGYDTLARTVQQIAQERKLISNAQVINVPGAGGTVGLAQFVNAKKPNGLLTIGLGMVGAITLNKSPVTLEQITPAARLQGEYQPLVVSAKSDIKTLDDLMAKYKADPGSVSWGGFGIGSPDHFVSALVIKAGGGDVKKMNYIVVGAGGEMLPFVISGKVTVATGGYAEFADHIKSGALRAIGISSPQRLAGIDVPTFKEQGYEVLGGSNHVIGGPKGMPKDVTDKLSGCFAQVAADPEFQKVAAERKLLLNVMDAKTTQEWFTGEAAMLQGLWDADPWLK